MTQPLSSQRYIARETTISIVINVVISLLFFLFAFGRSGLIPVWGVGGLVVDSLPQGFMIALMSTLISSALARRSVLAGRVATMPGGRAPSTSVVVRAVVAAMAAALCATGAMALGALALGVSVAEWTPALIVKLVLGGMVAAVVTPIALRAGLQPA